MEMQSPKFTVELLSPETMFWFVEVGATRMLLDELKRPELLNKQQLYALAAKGMADETAFVVKRGDYCVGALGALLVPNPLNPEIRTLAEIVWYVIPAARKTRAGVLLLKAFDEKAKEVADEATLSTLPSSDVNNSTLEKRGYYLSEYAFRKAIT